MIEDLRIVRRIRAMKQGSARLILLLSLTLSACSSMSERLREISADPGTCRPGTFIAAMTANCPQPVR